MVWKAINSSLTTSESEAEASDLLVGQARSGINKRFDVASDRLVGARRGHAMRVHVFAKICDPVADGATLATKAVGDAGVLHISGSLTARTPVVQRFGY